MIVYEGIDNDRYGETAPEKLLEAIEVELKEPA